MGGQVHPWLIGAATLALAVGAAGCGRSEVFFVESPVVAGTSGSGSGGVTIGVGSTTNGTSSGTTTGVVLPPVRTLAGNGTPSTQAGSAFADGSGSQAEFSGPEGVAVDAAGNVYVADSVNARIRKIDPSGNVTTLAGNGIPGNRDGTGGPNGTAEFHFPSGVAVDIVGNVYVADASNNRIAKVDPAGNVVTVEARGTELFCRRGWRSTSAEISSWPTPTTTA